MKNTILFVLKTEYFLSKQFYTVVGNPSHPATVLYFRIVASMVKKYISLIISTILHFASSNGLIKISSPRYKTSNPTNMLITSIEDTGSTVISRVTKIALRSWSNGTYKRDFLFRETPLNNCANLLLFFRRFWIAICTFGNS